MLRVLILQLFCSFKQAVRHIKYILEVNNKFKYK